MEKKDIVFEKESKKAHADAEKRNKDLKQQINIIMIQQDYDRKELKGRLDSVRTEHDNDQETLKDYAKQV